MKTALFGSVVILLTSAAIATARLPGQTLIDGRLQKEVTRNLMSAERAVAGSCTKSRVTDTEVTRQPKTAGFESGTGLTMAQWSERWAVDRCGRTVFYTIDFDMRGSSGTTFKIKAPRN